MHSDNGLSDSIMPAYPLADAYRGSQMKLGDFGQQNSEGYDQTDHVMPASTGLHQRMF
jgi:hypothetical protein